MKTRPVHRESPITLRGRGPGRPSRVKRLRHRVLYVLLCAAVPIGAARAQLSPVFVEDAPGAVEALRSAEGHAASGNLATAARVLQSLLTSNAERLTTSEDDEYLMVPVRDRVHAALLADAALLEQYRRTESAEAERQLGAGLLERVERERFLTPAGREAALRLAQRRMETARFSSALRVLREVDAHPDHRGARDGAARLAAELARYLPEAGALAERWALQDGEEVGALDPVEGPAIVASRGAHEPAPELDIESVVRRPIRSRRFADSDGDPTGMLSAGPIPARSRNGGRVQLDPARTIVPSLAGDLILLTDGEAVRGLDRYTLEQRWVVSGAVAGQRTTPLRSLMGAGPLTVGVWGRVAVAATVETLARQPMGNGLVHGIDTRTGARLWSVNVGAMHPDLSGALPTGTVVARDGLAVVVASRRLREKRLDNAVLVALTIDDGGLAWKRSVASAGALPQAQRSGAGSEPVIAGGVIYHAEPLGTVSAIELATGRFLWARRSRAIERDTPPAQLLWASRPLVREGVVYVIEPEGARVLALEARTGRVIGERDANDFGGPGALLSAGGLLVAASESELFTLPFDAFADAGVEPTLVFETGRGWFEGRPIESGDRVLAPTGEGYTLVDPRGEGAVIATIGFGNTGNAVVSGAQLATIDGSGVSSYLVWEEARAALEERMRAAPSDAAPAVTLAELAHRAGRHDAIVPAIDAALGALRRDSRSSRASAARTRLFGAIDAMIRSDEDGLETPDNETMSLLVARLGQAAATPAETALQRLRAGALAEATRRPGEAVAVYQRVLDDEATRRSIVNLGVRTVGAREEATRRLRRLVDLEGAQLYAVFEREASLALARERASGDPARLAEIARRYPVSTAALEAWVGASDAALARGKLRGSIGYLEEALAAADGVPGASDEIVGEIIGRLATRLVDGGRPAAASAVLARAAKDHPTLALTNRGELVDLAALERQIAQSRTRLARRPRFGALSEDDALTSIPDRLPMNPLFDSLDSDHSLTLLAGEEVIEAWEPDPAGGLARRWSAPLDPAMALLRLDSTGAIVSLGYDETRRLARLNGRTGEAVWETPFFEAAFPPDTAPGAGETVPLPAGSVRPRSELLVALRGDAAALVERSGRVAGYDIAEGRQLWARDVGLMQVFDAADSGGLLAMVGASPRRQANARLTLEPDGVVVDMQSGREVARLDFGEARPRWVRATRDGVAVVGTDRSILGFRLATGERLWETVDAAGRRTVEAWAFPGRLIVLDGAGGLWQVEIESGELSRTALETRNRLDGDALSIGAAAAGDSAVLALPRGVVIYDRRGELVGVDHRDSLTTLGPIAFGEHAAVVLEPRGFEPRLYEARVIELESGRLLQSKLVEMPARPHSIDLIDERVLVGAGSGVVVIDAPLK